MTDARYVIAGAARPRSLWFNEVSQWANAGSIPAEFVKCVGLAELRSHVVSGRPLSSLLIDGGLPGLDRDLFAVAAERDIAVIVARDPRVPTDWKALGAKAVLESSFERGALLSALSATSALVSRAEPTVHNPDDQTSASPIQGHTFAVTGTGGTGASTVAMALAQGLGRTAEYATNVALADLCLRADQAMLHDTQAVTPGIQELVERFRTRSLTPDDIRRLCFTIDGRGYDLLIGLRRRRFWTSLRPAACTSSLNAFANAYAASVFDVDNDVEGENESGSIDIEERNVLARTALRMADSVVVVGQASLKGLHSLTRVIHDLGDYGIDPSRIQPVLNYAPQTPERERPMRRRWSTSSTSRICRNRRTSRRRCFFRPETSTSASERLPRYRTASSIRSRPTPFTGFGVAASNARRRCGAVFDPASSTAARRRRDGAERRSRRALTPHDH